MQSNCHCRNKGIQFLRFCHFFKSASCKIRYKCRLCSLKVKWRLAACCAKSKVIPADVPKAVKTSGTETLSTEYTEGLKDRRNYTNFSNRRCKFSISPTRCSDRRYSCCKSSVSRGFKRFLKTDLMTIFYSSPRKNCKKPREKSNFYSLSIWGVAEVALNQCSWGATHATNTVWGVPDQKMQKHLVKVVFAGLLPFESIWRFPNEAL